MWRVRALIQSGLTAVAQWSVILLIACTSGPALASQIASNHESTQEIFQRGQRELAAGRYAEAERAFLTVLEREPNSPAAHTNLGVVYLRMGRLDVAITSLEQAARLAPWVAGIDLNLGLAYLRLSKYTEAIPHFRRALDLEPGQTRTRYLLGLSCYMADDYRAAVETLDPLYPEFSSQLDYLYIFGSSHGKTGNEREAARVFDQMLKVGGDSPRIHWLLGNAYLTQQVNQKAVAELEQARADPRLPYVHYSLALAYYRVKRLDEATKELNQEISLNPRFPSSYGLLGSIYLDLRQLDEATASYKKALELDPNQAAALYGLGRVCLLKGEADEALAYLQHAAQLKPDDDSIHYQLGQAYRKLGRKEDAQKELARAQALQASEREMLERKVLGELPPSPVQASPSPDNH
jgi:tetratricopeptide (TPR) repeat protein